MERTVRIAAIQAAPVVLDLEASVEKACALLADASGQGAGLAVLPECFLSIYPTNAWAGGIVGDGAAGSAIWERMWESSVAVDGPEVARLVAECRERNLICASASTSASPTGPAARSTTRCCCSVPTASSTATAS